MNSNIRNPPSWLSTIPEPCSGWFSCFKQTPTTAPSLCPLKYRHYRRKNVICKEKSFDFFLHFLQREQFSKWNFVSFHALNANFYSAFATEMWLVSQVFSIYVPSTFCLLMNAAILQLTSEFLCAFDLQCCSGISPYASPIFPPCST